MKKFDYFAKYTFADPGSPYDTHWWKNDATDYHRHIDYYELFLPLTDKLYQTYNDDKAVELDKNAVYLIPINQYHKIFHKLVTDRPVLFNLSVEPELFNISTEMYSRSIGEQLTGNDFITVCLEQVEYDYLASLSEKLKFVVDENKRRKLIMLFLASVATLYDIKVKNTDGFNTIENYASDLQTRIDNLEYLDTPITDIYKKYPVSPVMLIDAFKKLTGQTIVKYIVARRMSYACLLLQNTDFNVLVIAQEVGYDAPSHFIGNFKAYTGKTPSEYRKSARNYRYGGKTPTQ